MFQRIQSLHTEYIDTGFGSRIGAIYGKHKSSYQIIDTDFESEKYYIENTECLFTRLIIHEYSKRQLNVIVNLKKYYELAIRNFPQTSYNKALLHLSNEDYTISNYYSHLNFKAYLPCLIRHLDRLKFAGLLK